MSRNYWGGRSIEVHAKLDRWVNQNVVEVAERGIETTDVYEFAIDEYGEETAEWLDSRDQKPSHAWVEWWEETRDDLDEYGHPTRRFVNETRAPKLSNDHYDRLSDLLDSLSFGLGSNKRRKFMATLILLNREALLDNAEHGRLTDDDEDDE